MDILREIWVHEHGSVFVADAEEKLFPGGSKKPVRESVAFNVGERVAKHMVTVHNNALVKHCATQVANKTMTIAQLQDKLGLYTPEQYIE